MRVPICSIKSIRFMFGDLPFVVPTKTNVDAIKRVVYYTAQNSVGNSVKYVTKAVTVHKSLERYT